MEDPTLIVEACDRALRQLRAELELLPSGADRGPTFHNIDIVRKTRQRATELINKE